MHASGQFSSTKVAFWNVRGDILSGGAVGRKVLQYLSSCSLVSVEYPAPEQLVELQVTLVGRSVSKNRDISALASTSKSQ